MFRIPNKLLILLRNLYLEIIMAKRVSVYTKTSFLAKYLSSADPSC